MMLRIIMLMRMVKRMMRIDVAEDQVEDDDVADDEVKKEEDDYVENDPKTGTHTKATMCKN